MGLLNRDGISRMGEPQWLIAGVLPKGGVSLLYGPSGMGKSFWALDMAASVATGRKWNQCAVRGGPVVYVAGEGQSGYRVRLEAWERRHLGDGRAEAFYLYNEPVRLWARAGGVSESVQGFRQHVERHVKEPALVVFDTLGTCLDGADENDNGQMNQLCDSAEDVARPWGASVLLVHHTGKAGGPTPRGAQALQDRMAMHGSLTGDGKTWGMLTCTKQKEGERFEPIRRALKVVKLGTGCSSLAFGDNYKTGPRSKEKVRVTWNQIAALLASSSSALSPKDVATALGCTSDAAQTALSRALREGKVWQPGSGVYQLTVPGLHVA